LVLHRKWINIKLSYDRKPTNHFTGALPRPVNSLLSYNRIYQELVTPKK